MSLPKKKKSVPEMKRPLKTLENKGFWQGRVTGTLPKKEKVLRLPQTLRKPWENNDFSNPALASRSHSQGVPRWPPLTHRSNTVKTIGKSTFSRGGGGATRSRKRIHLGVAGKSYGFRKIMETIGKTTFSGIWRLQQIATSCQR